MCKNYLVFHIFLDVFDWHDSFKGLKAVWESLQVLKVKHPAPFVLGGTSKRVCILFASA
jgi:hypothetical protein